MATTKQKKKLTKEDVSKEVEKIINKKGEVETEDEASSKNELKSILDKYIEENKIFTSKELLGIDIFKPESDEIKNEHLKTICRVGHSIESILKELNQQNPDLSYLLVIEGTAAIPLENLKSGTYNPDLQYPYMLSYKRALAVYNFWRRNGIDLRKYNAEVLICGSGFNGRNRDTQNEDNNKRFVIQILPKVASTIANE